MKWVNREEDSKRGVRGFRREDSRPRKEKTTNNTNTNHPLAQLFKKKKKKTPQNPNKKHLQPPKNALEPQTPEPGSNHVASKISEKKKGGQREEGGDCLTKRKGEGPGRSGKKV